jgi:hypothetical protein
VVLLVVIVMVQVYQAPLLAFAKETISEMADIAMQVTQIFPAVLQLIPFNREVCAVYPAHCV